MARKKRRTVEVFSLSFLDAMTCGFGAVVLFFMVIQSSVEEKKEVVTVDRRAEVDRLEEQVLVGHENLVVLRNALRQVEQERVISQGLSRRLIETLQETREELATFEESTLAKVEDVNQLKADLKSLEEDTKRLSASLPDDETPGDRLRVFVGDGDRQYLTGLKVGGERIFVLVDSSASMLADTLVNVLLRRNLPAVQKLQSVKWRQAVASVDWVSTQLPRSARFQVYTFAESAKPAIEGTDRQWLDAGDKEILDRAVASVRRTVPDGGTNLWRGIEAMKAMKPLPDNVILLVDGLPTMGRKASRKGTIDARDRMKRFEDALDAMPPGVPVNVILFPMEGDPLAAAAYWQLALSTRGSFLTPSEDWP